MFIDSYQNNNFWSPICRVNGAALTGFESDVGSRTSFYTFSTNTMRNSMRSYARVGYRGPPISKVSTVKR